MSTKKQPKDFELFRTADVHAKAGGDSHAKEWVQPGRSVRSSRLPSKVVPEPKRAALKP